MPEHSGGVFARERDAHDVIVNPDSAARLAALARSAGYLTVEASDDTAVLAWLAPPPRTVMVVDGVPEDLSAAELSVPGNPV